MNIREHFSNLDHRQFYGLLISLAALSLVVMVSVLLLPQIKAYQAATKAHHEHPVLPVDSSGLPAMLSQVDSAITARAKLLHGDMANLPIREIEAFVIDRLQGIAWNHDVMLEGVQPVSGETIEAFREILFKLEISGHYDDLFAWLNELRTELGFTVIKEYQMDRVGDSAHDPLLRVQLTLASYRKERP